MATSTPDLLLQHTIDAIDAQGESAVRVKELADEVGVAVTSLYHFFGSREGLIEAAQAARYAAGVRETVSEFEAAVRGCRSQRELRAVVRRSMTRLFGVDHADRRMARINVFGSAHGRPHLAEKVATTQREAVARLAASLTLAQQKGWIRRDLDLVAFGSWLMGQITSRAMIEIGDTGVDGDAWNAVCTDAVFAVLFADVPSARRVP